MDKGNPTIGRIVHYVAATRVPDKSHWPAIVTQSHGKEMVNLQVFPNHAALLEDHFLEQIVHDEEHKSPGTWHWPERCE